MHAAVIDQPGEAPEWAEFAEPVTPGGRQVVELVAAGIHPLVRGLAAGRHYGSTGVYPMIPGVDAVARTEDGQYVYTGFVDAPYGTFAERMAVPATIGTPLPAGADPVRIAAGINPGMASWLPLRARLAETEAGGLGTVLIMGVTGVAGMLAAQIARALGASRVVGAGRNPAGLELVAARGADTVRITGDPDRDAASISGGLGGETPGIVLDFVWGAPAEAAFTALARRGLSQDNADIAYVEIGAMAGSGAQLPASLLRSRRIRLQGSGAGSADVAEISRELPQLMRLIAIGEIEVAARPYPISRVTEAWRATQEPGVRAVVVAERP